MEPLGIVVGAIMAAVLVFVAGYFFWRQRATLRIMQFDENLSSDQRRYLLKQCHRRIFGSALLLVLAAMMVGSLFLDLGPDAQVDREAAKQSLRFISLYVMAMLLVLLVILVLAVIDFWATARYGFEQQKQLALEHRHQLEAELLERRDDQSGSFEKWDR
jgi:H+/gluconate symporter-like permease